MLKKTFTNVYIVLKSFRGYFFSWLMVHIILWTLPCYVFFQCFTKSWTACLTIAHIFFPPEYKCQCFGPDSPHSTRDPVSTILDCNLKIESLSPIRPMLQDFSCIGKHFQLSVGLFYTPGLICFWNYLEECIH